ncbi:MAG TPA: phage holin family protein [Bacteriovoracaceae bacterium]|nr:phage holin family protein [Bacteriovoracaceae bacterium]
MERDINRDGSDRNASNVHRLYSDTHPRNLDQSSDHSWKVMVDRISNDMTTLWGKESLLIRSEINEKFSEAKAAFGTLAVGAALLFVGLIAAVFAAIYVLDVFMPLWLSAVIVTAILFVVGGVMIGIAKKKLEMDKLKPRHSIETLGEIKTTLKERVHEFRH